MLKRYNMVFNIVAPSNSPALDRLERPTGKILLYSLGSLSSDFPETAVTIMLMPVRNCPKSPERYLHSKPETHSLGKSNHLPVRIRYKQTISKTRLRSDSLKWSVRYSDMAN